MLRKPVIISAFCFIILITTAFEAKCEDSVLVGTLRVAGETLVGAGGGLALSGGATYLMGDSADPYNQWQKGERAEFLARLMTEDVAIAIGSSIGVYLIGVIGKDTGTFSEELRSFGATFGISVLSALLFFSGCIFPDMLSDFDDYGRYYEMDPWGFCVVPMNWGIISIGAVIGFNATRGYIISGDSEGESAKSAPAFCVGLIRGAF